MEGLCRETRGSLHEKECCTVHKLVVTLSDRGSLHSVVSMEASFIRNQRPENSVVMTVGTRELLFKKVLIYFSI